MADTEETEEASEDVEIAEEEVGEFEVHGPSGSKLSFLTESEATYFVDRSARYLSENHLENIADLQDIDRLLLMETMVHRWSAWLSKEEDYWGNRVDLDATQKSINDYSKELRLLKKSLGLDKASRDKAKGEGVAEYLANLRLRAKEFGVTREKMTTEAITLFNELDALITMHLNCDELERDEFDVHEKDVIEWISTIAIPRFHAIDAHFVEHEQKYWIKEL